MTHADYTRTGYERAYSICYRTDLFIYCIGDNTTHQMADKKNNNLALFRYILNGFKEFKEAH